MTTKLAVTVAVDMDATAVTIKPAGVLTRDNVRGLIAVARRAQRVLADFTVQADLDRVHAVAPEALRGLADAGVKTLVPRYGHFRRAPWHSRPGTVYAIHGRWRAGGYRKLFEIGPTAAATPAPHRPGGPPVPFQTYPFRTPPARTEDGMDRLSGAGQGPGRGGGEVVQGNMSGVDRIPPSE